MAVAERHLLDCSPWALGHEAWLRLRCGTTVDASALQLIPQLSNAGAIALCTIARRSICRAERSLSSVSAWHQQVVGTVTVRQLNLLPAAAGGADGGDGSTRYLTGWCRACIPYSAVQYSTVQVQQYSLCRCRCRALRTLLYCSRAL